MAFHEKGRSEEGKEENGEPRITQITRMEAEPDGLDFGPHRGGPGPHPRPLSQRARGEFGPPDLVRLRSRTSNRENRLSVVASHLWQTVCLHRCACFAALSVRDRSRTRHIQRGGRRQSRAACLGGSFRKTAAPPTMSTPWWTTVRRATGRRDDFRSLE